MSSKSRSRSASPVPSAAPGPSPRGRPRSEARRHAILAAAADLAIEQQGITTVDAIAARAGVSRTTVYRWWPSSAAVALEGLLDRFDAGVDPEDESDTRSALRLQLGELVSLFTDTPAGSLLRRVTAAASTDPVIAEALREQWLAPRREGATRILARGVRRGELRADLDLEAVVDIVFAPAYHRLTYDHARLDSTFVDGVIDALWGGIAAGARDGRYPRGRSGAR